MGVGASTLGVDAITARGLEPIFLFISYAKGKCVYFWIVKPHKHYYICREFKISKAGILNYCRRFRESVKCKCKETEFYKISLHYTPFILKRMIKI